jgi:hypothetical protein
VFYIVLKAYFCSTANKNRNNIQKKLAMLPKFLLADNSLETPDTIFVVHTESPRFIVEADIDDFWSNQEIHWIDGEPGDEDLITQLIEEAEEFLEREFDNEELLDEQDDDDDE